MARIVRQSRSDYWYAHFKIPTGRWVERSTGTKDPVEAQRIADEIERAALAVLAGPLSPERTRNIVEGAIASIIGDGWRTPSTRVWAAEWLDSRCAKLAPSSCKVYRDAIGRFIKHLGKRADEAISAINHYDALTFRDGIKLSPNSVNLFLTVCTSMFATAMKAGIIQRNPFVLVSTMRVDPVSKRVPYTHEEIDKLLAATRGTDWEGMILMALYTGQRLGDILKLKKEDINMETRTIRFVAQKTGTVCEIPMAEPVYSFLLHWEIDTVTNFVFFHSWSKGSNQVSALYHKLLKRLKLSRPGLCFHSLRHTCVTWLKAAGASEAVAQAWVGHASSSVSRLYTHLGRDDLARVISMLPVVGNEESHG